jgi:hypothetical protein
MMRAERTTRELSTSRTRRIVRGAWAQVESGNGDVWAALVTYVSEDLVGLRGSTLVDGRFSLNDHVTLVVGKGETLVATQARILGASGTLMRLVRRESFEGPQSQRRAPRVPVSLRSSIALNDGLAGTGRQADAHVVDLSSLGCALRVAEPIPIGRSVTIRMPIGGTDVIVEGTVVRAWAVEAPMSYAVGIEFEHLVLSTSTRIKRFLVGELRTLASPSDRATTVA